MFALDRNSPVALADQIEARLRELVARGQLPAGARLTSIRQLAGELAVSPNTVISAYDRLVAAGVIDARSAKPSWAAECLKWRGQVSHVARSRRCASRLQASVQHARPDPA